jgi:hypothetical protein
LIKHEAKFTDRLFWLFAWKCRETSEGKWPGQQLGTMGVAYPDTELFAADGPAKPQVAAPPAISYTLYFLDFSAHAAVLNLARAELSPD